MTMSRIKERLQFLYGDKSAEIYLRIQELIGKWRKQIDSSYPWVDRNDVVLIAYGDAIQKEGMSPLSVLSDFLDEEMEETINTIHLLPMFPFTSDDGFSVIDFREINPELGTWKDIETLKENYNLMFDAVINHVSKSSIYFREFLKGSEKYKNFFIVADPNADYSSVTRPRALPLLTAFETTEGKKYVWTTFSDDQIDLNYKSPEVLLEILDILLLYVSKGARFLRLDAIGFAWKEPGTTCMHLPQTHELVKLIREVLEACAQGCTIITETNVPHKDNISYFGDGTDEAGLVYQFPLPPLTLYSYISQDAQKLTKWAASLEPTSAGTTFFNFLASHDGIGMRPVEDILTDEERQKMVDAVLERGGQIGFRTTPDGREVPYELNINYLDAVAGNEMDEDVMVQKFMGTQCILLSVMGVPGIYYHSLLGSRNCYRDYEQSGIKRRINREKLNLVKLKEELGTDTLRRKVFLRYKSLLRVRKSQKAFDPGSVQQVLELHPSVFALLRGEKDECILVLVNVSDEKIGLETSYCGMDLLSGEEIKNRIILTPYGFHWIKLKNREES